MRELQSLEQAHPEFITPDSPTQRVGGKPREGFTKIPHSSPMLSLDNALGEAELREFDARVRALLGDEKFTYVAELKMDGLSLAVHYRDGRIFQAVTRGDGVIGEEVTENAKTIRSIPLRLKSDDLTCEVRGEVVLTEKSFDKANAGARSRRAFPDSPTPATPPPDRSACSTPPSPPPASSITSLISCSRTASPCPQSMGIARKTPRPGLQSQPAPQTLPRYRVASRLLQRMGTEARLVALRNRRRSRQSRFRRPAESAWAGPPRPPAGPSPTNSPRARNKP